MAYCLSFCERSVIERLVCSGRSFAEIGRVLGRASSTISREVARNGGRDGYGCDVAEKRASRKRKRPKIMKFLVYPDLGLLVYDLLSRRKMSPPTIAVYLKQLGLETRVCAETIYQACYRSATALNGKRVAQRRKSGLPDNSCDLLPRAKKKRKRRTLTRRHHLGQKFKHISKRTDPGMFGHWEGDLIAGTRNKSFVITLIEQKTKYTLLGELRSRKGHEFADKIVELISSLPAHVFNTITWDRGTEASKWQRIEDETGVEVFFTSPKSPWQRPLNEQNNSVLRKWLPNSTNIWRPQNRLNQIADELNSHPRKILEWETPEQELSKYTKQSVHH